MVTLFFSADFIFNFMQEYQDKETFVRIRDHKKIIAKYAKSGQMILDFVATFPFSYFLGDDLIFTRLVRLTRLSKLIAIFDISRMKRIIKSYYENSTRSDRLQSQYMVMYSFRIFRLVIIASLITYMIGCAWWGISITMNSRSDIAAKGTFVTRFGLDRLYEKEGNCADLLCYLDEDDTDERCIAEWIEENGCLIDYRA